jgi:hypothetical protein
LATKKLLSLYRLFTVSCDGREGGREGGGM